MFVFTEGDSSKRPGQLVLDLHSAYNVARTENNRPKNTEIFVNIPQAVLAFHVVCWIAQFVGHGVFEKRAPALLDSVDQAFITAPLFVLLEVKC